MRARARVSRDTSTVSRCFDQSGVYYYATTRRRRELTDALDPSARARARDLASLKTHNLGGEGEARGRKFRGHRGKRDSELMSTVREVDGGRSKKRSGSYDGGRGETTGRNPAGYFQHIFSC